MERHPCLLVVSSCLVGLFLASLLESRKPVGVSVLGFTSLPNLPVSGSFGLLPEIHKIMVHCTTNVFYLVKYENLLSLSVLFTSYCGKCLHTLFHQILPLGQYELKCLLSLWFVLASVWQCSLTCAMRAFDCVCMAVP